MADLANTEPTRSLATATVLNIDSKPELAAFLPFREERTRQAKSEAVDFASYRYYVVRILHWKAVAYSLLRIKACRILNAIPWS